MTNSVTRLDLLMNQSANELYFETFRLKMGYYSEKEYPKVGYYERISQ